MNMNTHNSLEGRKSHPDSGPYCDPEPRLLIDEPDYSDALV